VNIPKRPAKVKYICSNQKITSFAGLKLVADLATRLGVVAALERLTVKKRRRGVPICDVIMSLVRSFLVGGEHLSDLDVLRGESATRELLYGLQVPAPTTAGETLRKFNLGHIKQLEAVNSQAMRRGAELVGGSEPVTLDLDSSVFEVHGYLKEGARYSYRGIKGFHPLLCFWSQTRLLIGARLRAGNRSSAHKVRSFLGECLSRLPKGRTIQLRLDAGFYSREIVEHLLGRALRFSISACLTTALRRAIEGLPQEAWKNYPWEDEAEWTEFSYRPKKWPRALRMLVKRTPYYEGDQRLLGEYFYTCVITNRCGAGSSLMKHHLGRGGAENYIEEFKNGLGARLLPTQKFLANWTWLVIAQLAYNLGQWFKLLLLPSRDHGHQLKRLRLLWFCVAGRITRSGRRTTLALARAAETVQAFIQVQAAVLRL
jgi:hypothetical protein